jgi:uncharacterized protein YbaR (Trm112 family)
MIDPELLEILVCPETKQSLTQAGEDVLNRLNQAVQGGYVENQGGRKVTATVHEGLVREDGKILYPVKEDIPIMLVDEAIRLDSLP